MNERIKQLFCKHKYELFIADLIDFNAFYKCAKCGHIIYAMKQSEHFNCRCGLMPYSKEE